jgi:hypothetical protein
MAREFAATGIDIARVEDVAAAGFYLLGRAQQAAPLRTEIQQRHNFELKFK